MSDPNVKTPVGPATPSIVSEPAQAVDPSAAAPVNTEPAPVAANSITEIGDVVVVQLGLASKRYQTLSSMPTGSGLGRIAIGRCSAMLANHMQCWRAADFHIISVTPDKTEIYQKCRAHAAAELAQDDTAVKAANASTPPPPPPTTVTLP